MDERSERVARRLEGPLLAAALLTIPALVIEESSAEGPWSGIAMGLNWATWLAFLVEVVVMLRVVPDRGRWLRAHPLDLAILVLTPPFLPSSLQATRILRLLRLLRLVRAAALARRLLSTEGVKDAGLFAIVTVLAGGAAFSAFESDQRLSAWDGVWWAITTVTTVGYGDIYPQTVGGRLTAMVVMAAGIGFVAVLTAAAAERVIASRREAESERAEITRRLDEVLERLERMESGR